ncbi:hypothetical protein HNQ38_001385 [Desulfovibrio intestinalis]|uniref:Uncharacterized protein n=1 Tax=Desulfovibrio intestinalis TaxID=58621 RepID=A0A7W8FGZ7_9BACT|nr:hypothetical protein [Desulfovibrio intestinalis]
MRRLKKVLGRYTQQRRHCPAAAALGGRAGKAETAYTAPDITHLQTQ